MTRQLSTIDSKQYQVFLFCCPANIPCNIARHSWFVCNEKGKISRWEVLMRERKGDHLFTNFFPPFDGIDMLPVSSILTWTPRLLAKTEGDLAKNMIRLIKTSNTKYPYCHQYSSFGPNSNTYIQWILDQFPEFQATLPWNAFGKNYT